MTMELNYGLILIVILVFLIIFAVLQENKDKKIINEAIAVEDPVVIVDNEVIALPITKPKKKRKYRPKNPQNKK